MSREHRRLVTGIDGLDLILDGGFRYPKDGSLFLVILGGPGTGKTHLAPELAVRLMAQPEGAGAIHLLYGLDQSPQEIHGKLSDDFDHYGVSGTWDQMSGFIQREDYQAILHSVQPDAAALSSAPSYFLSASVKDPRKHGVNDPTALFERLDRDIDAVTAATSNMGQPMRPRMVTIDNISLKTFDNGEIARSVIRTIRDRLALRQMHGVFVVETPGSSAERATFAAAEYAADIIVQLGYHEFGDQFKERSIEIAKARHQFYFRGTHHFSIVGKSDDSLRGARGQRAPGIHVYPSIPTLLSYLEYRQDNENLRPRTVEFGADQISVQQGSSNGLLGSSERLIDLLRVSTRFLLAGEGDGIMVSFHQMGDQVRELAKQWHPNEQASKRIHVLSFGPEYMSSGKFLKDVYDAIEELRARGRQVSRAALFGLEHLRWGFPLLHDSRMLIPWLTSFFRSQNMTSLYVETSERMEAQDRIPEDSAIAATVDNVLKLHGDPMHLRILRGLNAQVESGS